MSGLEQINLILRKPGPFNAYFSFQDSGSARGEGTDEGSELAGTSPAGGVHCWALFAILLDRVHFLIFIMVYLFLFGRCFV